MFSQHREVQICLNQSTFHAAQIAALSAPYENPLNSTFGLDDRELLIAKELRMSTNPKPSAVLYANDITRVANFYAKAIGFSITHTEASHVVLESSIFQLVVHAIPTEIAATIEIATPPIRREDTPIKLGFPVASISATRIAAAKHGGELNAQDREWEFQGRRVCDGHDPEGNVIQVSEAV
jgi:predicted enzyme related to lactoylglutathione lyase